jgi:4-hydroxy-3-methylbut-2-enyl diphosphate reductase
MPHSITCILLAQPHGFCAGVTRAVHIVEKALEKYGAPLYIKHEIVHNKTVVENFEKKGVITIESLNDVPDNSNVIFSAHGSLISDFDLAKKKNLKVIDAVCPLVWKVHLEAKNFLKKGYDIIYLGKPGHQEPKAVLSEAEPFNKKIYLFDASKSVEEQINKLPKIPLHPSPTNLETNSYKGGDSKVACLNQTTLNVNKVEKMIKQLKKRYLELEVPKKEDVCFATTNRQKAVLEIAKKSDIVIVVGSRNSSNSNKLVEVAKKQGVPAYLVDDMSEIEEGWLNNKKILGLTAGASAPEKKIKEIVKYFNVPIKELSVGEEEVSFPILKI